MSGLPGSEDSYVHGSHPDEQCRLTTLNDLINRASLREIGLGAGEQILDVGSGLGQFTRAMARAAGRGAKVIGVERDERQRSEAIRQAREHGEEALVEMRAGDALNLPLRPEEWGAFDLAHTRFLLEHVPDPLDVVRSMVRAVRPGGRVVLADDDHDVLRLYPELPDVMRAWRSYIETYRRLHNDPFVGRRLVSLLRQAGARPTRNTWLFFGSCAGHEDFPTIVENLARIFEGARDSIAAGGEMTREHVDLAVRSLRDWGSRDDSAFWYAIFWAEGVRPLEPDPNPREA